MFHNPSLHVTGSILSLRRDTDGHEDLGLSDPSRHQKHQSEGGEVGGQTGGGRGQSGQSQQYYGQQGGAQRAGVRQHQGLQDPQEQQHVHPAQPLQRRGGRETQVSQQINA